MTTAMRAPREPFEVGALPRYLRRVHAFPMLAPEEERALARKAQQDEDASAIARLTTSHLRLVAKVARRYGAFGLPMSELIAEGNLGMVRAVQRFDPDRGFRLSTFAVWWIRAAIQDHILRSWSLVRIGTTRGQKRLFFNLRRLKSSTGMLEEGELAPGQAEKIAASLGVPRAEVVSMNGRLSGADLSLNAPVGSEGDSELQDWLVDERPTPEDSLAEAEERHHRRHLLNAALGVLPERERQILVERRLKERPATLNELSRRYDVSAERVRQIELAAYKRLKSAILHASSAPRAFPASGRTGSRRGAGQLAPDCAPSLCSMADAKQAAIGARREWPSFPHPPQQGSER
ncbi:MAG TPA: RNA polymerase sigma factor RpoH [Dongiaceae bacterium]|nr:RNA polymerase sigma factor RpoH [Dongiaceae bacterium]